VYATRPAGRWIRIILSRFAGLRICANCADAPGQLRGVPPSGCCPNFRRARPPLIRATPPDPPNDRAAFIPLTQGHYAMIDADDLKRVGRYKWCLSRSGHRLYAYRKHRRKSLYRHQFILNPPRGKVVDHIDGNGLNNRRRNLRFCTPQQNAWNQKCRRKKPDASSQYIGVHQPRKQPGKWYIQIKCGDDRVRLGPFETELQAARARDRKALELHGEFARLNFPQESHTGDGRPLLAKDAGCDRRERSPAENS
jgi:hypothetical protein